MSQVAGPQGSLLPVYSRFPSIFPSLVIISVKIIDSIFFRMLVVTPVKVIDGISFRMLVITQVKVIDILFLPSDTYQFVPQSVYIHCLCICSCIAGIHMVIIISMLFSAFQLVKMGVLNI